MTTVKCVSVCGFIVGYSDDHQPYDQVEMVKHLNDIHKSIEMHIVGIMNSDIGEFQDLRVEAVLNRRESLSNGVSGGIKDDNVLV